MLKILNSYEIDGLSVIEYTKDGSTISHIVKTPIPREAQEPEPSIEEEILFETKYQTMLLEMGGM